MVTGTFEPLPLEEADRNIRSIPLGTLRLTTNSFSDLLRLDPSLDVRGRAPNLVQTDISIRGAGFGQSLILLNGFRLNDAQSGHHNLDVPVPVESIDRIEVLKGSGSTFYGSDAVGGVVNFITKRPESSEVRLRGALGNFGVNQQEAVFTYANTRLTQQFAVSRDFSTGFLPDRDYRNLSLSSDTNFTTRWGNTDILLANNDRPFGADQFYGNYNSWERTRTWFASIRQELGSHMEADFAYRRHTDLFVLYRDRPQVFTNRHESEGVQSALRRWDSLSPNVRLSYGLELFTDSVYSNNLGHHSRARSAGYAALDVRALRRFSFNAGIRDEVYGSFNHEVSPTFSAGYWLSSRLKLRAAVTRAFRLPTYTDLYYHDPANLGSPNLKPERAWTFEGGVDAYLSPRLRAQITVFQRRESNGIDYVRYSPADIWRATNFQSLSFTGVEAALRLKQFAIEYTGLQGAQDQLHGIYSKYSFNYPIHSGVVSWEATWRGGLLTRTRVGVLERFARDPYGVLDLYVAGTRGRWHPFVQLTNLTDTVYEEIFGVPMPGRAVVGGVELVWRRN